MHGPPLSSAEVVAFLERAIGHLEDLGLDREEAISAASVQYGVRRERVVWLLAEHHPIEPAAEAVA